MARWVAVVPVRGRGRRRGDSGGVGGLEKAEVMGGGGGLEEEEEEEEEGRWRRRRRHWFLFQPPRVQLQNEDEV